MKIIHSLVILTILFGCSNNKNNHIEIKDSWKDGIPKVIIINSPKSNQGYYQIELDSLGQIRSLIPFENEQKTGTEIRFRDKMEVSGLQNYLNGKRNGYTYELYPKLSPGFIGCLVNGEFNGISNYYHRNGKLRRTGIRKNNQSEGEWIEFYENGKLQARGSYIHGEEQKDWKYWDEDGVIIP